MAEYPYLVATKRLGKYFEMIQDVGQPDVADSSFLKSIGFGTENDRRILKVWEFIGFVDESKNPTDRWSSYRNKEQAPKVLAGAITEAYSGLFRTYSNAYERDTEALSNIISAASPKASQNVIGLVVSTFRELCDRADFGDGSGEVSEAATDEPAPDQDRTSEEVNTPAVQPTAPATMARSQPTVHINLQIHISAEAGPEQIDQIFASMAKHLYDR